MRTCIGCGQIREKKELIRIVRTPEGRILVDPTGRANGRGAYICPDPACVDKARRRKALRRAFDGGVDDGQYGLLSEQLKELLR